MMTELWIMNFKSLLNIDKFLSEFIDLLIVICGIAEISLIFFCLIVAIRSLYV